MHAVSLILPNPIAHALRRHWIVRPSHGLWFGFVALDMKERSVDEHIDGKTGARLREKGAADLPYGTHVWK